MEGLAAAFVFGMVGVVALVRTEKTPLWCGV
jgi:hypothetical protein